MTRDACPEAGRLALVRDGIERDSKVIAHVQSCDACQALLTELAELDVLVAGVATSLRVSGVAAEQETRSDAPHYAGYVIGPEIERGGQGVVYRAEHAASKRIVALKVMRVDSARNRARLEREARLAARLRHPNIVTVHDCAELPDGRFAIAMEWVEGQPLDAWASSVREDASISPSARLDRLLGVLVRLSDAVEHAHRNGVIHRDLKPGNILVDVLDQPRVLDFGVAADADGGADSRVTMTGEIACTLTHAAPERLMRDGASLADTRADVYSLGVVMFEALTGTRPSDGPGGVAELIDRVRTVDSPPVASRATPACPVPRDLDTIVAKALARDPERRYASAAALRDDLTRCRAGEAIDARRDSLAYVARMAMRRHRVGLSVAAVCTVAVLAGGAAVLWSAIATRDAQLRETIERERMRGESSRSAAVANILQQVLPRGESTPGDWYSGPALQGINALTQSLGHGLFADDPLAIVATRVAIGDVSVDRGGLRRAEVEYRQALRVMREFDGARSTLGAIVLTKTAALLSKRSSTGEAIEMIDEAIPILTASLGDRDPATIEARVVRAEVLAARGERAQALAALDEIYESLAPNNPALAARVSFARLEALGPDAPQEPTKPIALELARSVMLAYSDLDARFERALDALAASADSALADEARALASALRATSIAIASPETLERVILVKRMTLGDENRDLVETYSELARRLFGLKRFDEACTAFDRAVALAMPQGSPRTVDDLDLLYERLRTRTYRPGSGTAPHEAVEGLDQLVEMNRALLAEHAPLHLVTRLRELGRECARVGLAREARALSQEAIERAKLMAVDSPHLGWVYVEVGFVENLLGDYERAIELITAGMEILDGLDSSWSFHRAVARERLGHSQGRLGRFAASKASFQQARRMIMEAGLPAEDRDAIAAIIDGHLASIERGEKPTPAY